MTPPLKDEWKSEKKELESGEDCGKTNYAGENVKSLPAVITAAYA